MAEATVDPQQAAALQDLARELDRARMRKIGGYHFAMVVAALTLWGAAASWAESSGWALASFAAAGTALVAGSVIPSVLHEWGHFTGARLSGAVSPVLEEPRDHFFMFDFKMGENDVRQFTWMSWGGILAPWLVLLLAAVSVPWGAAGAAVLLATLLYKAVAVTVFEGPVVSAAGRSGDPGAELGRSVRAGGLKRGRDVGLMAGAICFVLLWLGA